MVSGHHHLLLLFLETACLVASAAADTDADTDDDWNHYESDDKTSGSLCDILTGLFPFGVPVVFPCVAPDVWVLIAKNVFFRAFADVHVLVVWAVVIANHYVVFVHISATSDNPTTLTAAFSQ